MRRYFLLIPVLILGTSLYAIDVEYIGNSGQNIRLKAPSSGVTKGTPSSGIFNIGSGGYQAPGGVGGVIFDFDAAEGIDAVSGAVSRWIDSGNPLNITTQTSSGNRPTYTTSNSYFNGFPTVDFSSTSTHWLGLQGSTHSVFSSLNGINKPMTIFMVARKPRKPIVANETGFSFGDSVNLAQNYADFQTYRFANSNSDRQYVRVRGSTNTAETGLQGTDDLVSYYPQVMVYEFDGFNAHGYVMNFTQNPTYDLTVDNLTSNDYSVQGTFAYDQFTIGALRRVTTIAQPVTMELARLVGYSRQLSASERADVGAYLFNKYIDQDPTIEDLVGVSHNWDVSQSSINVGAPVDSLVDQVGGKNFTASLSTRPIIALGPNGLKVLEFDGINDFMTAGVAADWRVLNDTNPVSVFIVYRTMDEDRSSLEPLLDTVNSSHTVRNGLGMYHYNVGGSSHTFNWLIGAADANPVVNRHTQGMYVTPLEWHVAAFNYDHDIPSSEENFKPWLDNENYESNDFVTTPANADPSFALHLGKLANTNTFAKIQIAQVVILKRNVGWRYETSLINKALARKWGVGISAVVGGDGIPNFIEDTNKHRAFPATTFDSNDQLRVLYRRAVDHGSSAGVAIEAGSSNGIDWSGTERVVAEGEVASGISDIRIGSGYERITSGPLSGRLCWATEISSSNSDLVPGTVYAYYSDDNASSFTRVHVNPEQSGFDLNGSAAGMKWLQSGKMLMTFAASQPTEGSGDQDIYITTSADCSTWSTPTVLIDHNNIAYRITETDHVQYADGMILTLWRDDTNHVIYKATTTNEFTTFSTATAFSGWGWPNVELDENERLYVFYRSEALTNRAVWRYSDDRGITWSDEFQMSTLSNANEARHQYGTMTYTDVTKNSSGDMWLAFGLESDGSDVFAKKFRAYPVVSTATISGIDGVQRWWSTYGLSNSYDNNASLTSWPDFSTNNDDAVAINPPLYKENFVSTQSIAQFDGVDDYMTFTETAYSEWTIFFAISNAAGPLLSNNANGDILSMDTTFAFINVAVSGGNYTWNLSALSEYDVVAINSDGEIWINGVQGTSSSVPGSNSLVVSRIGGTPVGSFIGANVGDILIADDVLGSTDMDTIGQFLTKRWNKTWQ